MTSDGDDAEPCPDTSHQEPTEQSGVATGATPGPAFRVLFARAPGDVSRETIRDTIEGIRSDGVD